MKNETLYNHPLWYYIKNNPRPFVLGMSFLFITNSLDAVYPLIMKKAIDQIEGMASMSDITRTCILFLAIMASLAFTRYTWRAHFGKFHSSAAEHIRQKLFGHLTTLGPNFFHKNQIAFSYLTPSANPLKKPVTKLQRSKPYLFQSWSLGSHQEVLSSYL